MNNNWVIGLILAILLVSIAIIFALQNSEPTAISFLSWDLALPLALIILTSFAIGALTALLLTIPGSWKRRKQLSVLKKEKQRLVEQLDKAKTSNKVIESINDTNEPNTTNF